MKRQRGAAVRKTIKNPALVAFIILHADGRRIRGHDPNSPEFGIVSPSS